MGKVDANFFIMKDGAKLGQIRISKGGMDYYPANKKNPIKIKWTQLDQMFREWNEKSK